MTIVSDTIMPPCADAPEAYLDEALQATSITTMSAAERDKLIATRAAIHRQCAGCPLLVECLYRAVVEVDVSGYVACTTEAERGIIREQLGIEVMLSTLTPQYWQGLIGVVLVVLVLVGRERLGRGATHLLRRRSGAEEAR